VHSISHYSHNASCHHRSSNNNQTFYKTSRIHAARSQTTIRDDGTSTSGRDATYKDFHCSKTATGWHPLCQPLVWQGKPRLSSSSSSIITPTLTPTTTSYNTNSLLDYLSPPWKVMLLSDGSVTRHLQLLTDINVTVDCFEQREIGTERTDLPSLARLIPGPSLVQRQVLLHNGDPNTTVPYVYAASWWSSDTIDKYLKDKQQPIWVSLSEGRAELYREILGVECGGNEYLEE